MARIRSIKPEIWTDERLTECSVTARLLFIGMLNFADDNGNQVASAKRIKMQVFPADAIDATPLINELMTHGLIIEYSVSGSKYWNIKGFKKHQVINRPSKTSIPEPSVHEGSVSAHSHLTDGEEGKGEERKELEPAIAGLSPAAPDDAFVLGDDDSDVRDEPARMPCPHVRIIALYHEVLPELRQVREWNETRRRLLQRRWSEQPERQAVDWWREFFGYVRRSRFLMGRTVGRDGRPFDCDLEWLIRPTNFTKVIEGKYEDEAA